MSHYTKKDIQEPLLLEGGDEKANLIESPSPVDDGILTR
jgi:hypothetical protein